MGRGEGQAKAGGSGLLYGPRKGSAEAPIQLPAKPLPIEETHELLFKHLDTFTRSATAMKLRRLQFEPERERLETEARISALTDSFKELRQAEGEEFANWLDTVAEAFEQTSEHEREVAARREQAALDPATPGYKLDTSLSEYGIRMYAAGALAARRNAAEARADAAESERERELLATQAAELREQHQRAKAASDAIGREFSQAFAEDFVAAGLDRREAGQLAVSMAVMFDAVAAFSLDEVSNNSAAHS